MGASILIKTAMLQKGIKLGELAKRTNYNPQALSVKLNRDSMNFDGVQQLADALGCDVVLRDRASGKIYG